MATHMDMEMDIDIDIDLGLDQLQPPPDPTAESFNLNGNQLMIAPDVSNKEVISHKVHVRGVDDLHTNDIRAFSTTYFPLQSPQIEWIDDTSANIVFDDSDSALSALHHYSQELGDSGGLDRLQARRAKAVPSHPESIIYARIAVASDRKRPRAYEASKFYMMHPELDPREQRRGDRRRESSGYRRRRYDNEEHNRRRRGDEEGRFVACMYDDDAGGSDPMAIRRRSASFSSGSFRDSRRSRRGRGASRNRSASPENDTQRNERLGGARRRTPPPRYGAHDPHPFPIANSQKELFPSKRGPRDISNDIRGLSDAAASKELIPNKTAASNLQKELFPRKAGIHQHRRSGAFDAADETADLFASGMSVPFVDGATDTNRLGGTTSASPGFSIRGAANQQPEQFSIRGASNSGISSAAVRDLFPGKVGNAGKELFAEKLQGRGGRKTRAVDMFG